MNLKPIIIAACCAIAIVVGIYFGGIYYLSQSRPDISTEKTTTAAGEQKQPPVAKGHWHGEVWHTDDTHTPPTQATKQEEQPNEEKIGRFSDLPSEVRAKAWVEFYRQRGVDGPPPEGYHYVWINGKAQRDENGNPILIKNEDPYFQPTTCIGFRPTPEQYEQYKQLQQKAGEIFRTGTRDEYNQINAELRRFREAHRGELPAITSLAQKGYNRNDPRHSKRRTEILAELYRKAGLDYLIPELY